MKTDKLKKLSACSDARVWVATQRNYKEAWQNCERGDWMLWLAKALNVDDRKLTLAKYHCVNQVRHLMEDQRSIDALNAALKYANGEINEDELNTAATDAADAYIAAATAATATAAGAAYAAVAAATATAAATAATATAAGAAYAAYAAVAAADAYIAAVAAADAADYAATDAAATDTYTYNAARRKSLKKSADICREILTEEVLTAYKKLKP